MKKLERRVELFKAQSQVNRLLKGGTESSEFTVSLRAPLIEQVRAKGPDAIRVSGRDSIVAALSSGQPVFFSRFNDGEAMALNGESALISRGNEKVSQELTHALHVAISTHSPGLLLGLPCPACFPNLYGTVEALRLPESRVTFATVLQNGWPEETMGLVMKALRGRKAADLIWVGGDKQSMAGIERLSRRSWRFFPVPEKFAFEDSLTLRKALREIKKESIVMLSCGPLSRVIVSDLAQGRAAGVVSAIDIGSLFDPLTKNTSYRYHQWNGAVCELCRGPLMPRG